MAAEVVFDHPKHGADMLKPIEEYREAHWEDQIDGQDIFEIFGDDPASDNAGKVSLGIPVDIRKEIKGFLDQRKGCDLPYVYGDYWGYIEISNYDSATSPDECFMEAWYLYDRTDQTGETQTVEGVYNLKTDLFKRW